MSKSARFSDPIPDAGRNIPVAIRRFVWERDGGKCVDCGCETGLQYDHDNLPWALVKRHDQNDIRLRCLPCHKIKSAAQIGSIKKALRLERNHFNGKPKSKRPIKSNPKIQSAGFGNIEKRKWPSRPFTSTDRKIK